MGTTPKSATPSSAPPPHGPSLCTSPGYPNANLRLGATARSKCDWLSRDRGFTAEKSSSRSASPYQNLKPQPCTAVLVLLSSEGADAFLAADVKMIFKEGNVLRKVEPQQSF